MWTRRTDSIRPRNRHRMATSPWALNSTSPLRSTSAMARLLLANAVNCVTSVALPSSNVARTASCCHRAGAFSTRVVGVMAIDFSPTGAASSRRPSACQSRMIRADGLSARNRRPPTCGTRATALDKIRLRSGSSGFVRRENRSCVSCWKSRSGLEPHKLSRNPFLPLGAP